MRAKAKITSKHRDEREKLENQQRQRWQDETKARADRLNAGLRGLWDRLSGTRAKTIKQNERDAYEAPKRDKDQKQTLITAQLQERQKLQGLIRQQRAKDVQER